MLRNSFFQLSLLATAALLQLAATADVNKAHVQQILQNPKVAGMDAVQGVLMHECDNKISVCGKTANIKVIHKHAKTVYSTKTKIFEEVTTLEPEFSTVTEVKFTTITTSTEGQCRNTTTIVDDKPLHVTIEVSVTTTREFVPVKTTTTTRTSTVSEKAIEQCLIKSAAAAPSAYALPQKENPSAKKGSNEAKDKASTSSTSTASAAKKS